MAVTPPRVTGEQARAAGAFIQKGWQRFSGLFQKGRTPPPRSNSQGTNTAPKPKPKWGSPDDALRQIERGPLLTPAEQLWARRPWINHKMTKGGDIFHHGPDDLVKPDTFTITLRDLKLRFEKGDVTEALKGWRSNERITGQTTAVPKPIENIVKLFEKFRDSNIDIGKNIVGGKFQMALDNGNATLTMEQQGGKLIATISARTGTSAKGRIEITGRENADGVIVFNKFNAIY